MLQSGSPRSWRKAFVKGIDAAQAIARQKGSCAKELNDMVEADRAFGFRATDYYLSLADPSDPADPILAQVLPDAREMHSSPLGYCADAVGDLDPANHSVAGLVHKYPGRALLITTSACPVHCRYCFRRSYPYEELVDAGRGLRRAVDVIRADTSITEVILSGGDPLSLSEASLSTLLHDLAAIDHVRRVRVHTRYPVVLPERIDEALVEVLANCGLPVWLVTHFNHPRELTESAVASCKRLQRAGIPVLNQSVLLAGVNDDLKVLSELCDGLLDAGIKPYYLHQLDRVTGIAHFEVAEARAAALYESLRARISGIGLPALVRDLPGRLSKTPLALLLALLLTGPLLLGGCKNPTAPAGKAPTPGPVTAVTDAKGPVVTREGAVAPSSTTLAKLSAQSQPFAAYDHLIAADLEGDGQPELFAAHGAEIRWGEWPVGTAQPLFEWSYAGQGILQAFLSKDLDGDGRDEVVLAFGKGRGFADAQLEVVLIKKVGEQPVSRVLTRSDGPRNQATALQAWPRVDGSFDLYIAAFETRFMVRGGVLSRDGGEVSWMPGHRIRMGMARAVGDFDADGKPEVAVGRLYGDQKGEPGDLRVVQQDGSSEPIETLRGVRALSAADLNGDGHAELLFGDGWHINYGKLARYRPSVARRTAQGWRVELIEESAAQYAVEHIAATGGLVIAAGNTHVRIYGSSEAGWSKRSGPWPSSMQGAWALLPGRGLVTGGQALRGPHPLPLP